MNLLDRIAHSSGDPQRTIAALRVINERLERELSRYSECASPELDDTSLTVDLRRAENEQRAAYYGAVAEELAGYCGVFEKRCEHLEGVVKATASLLQVAMKDFESQHRKPMFSTVVARLKPVAAFLETALANAPNPDAH